MASRKPEKFRAHTNSALSGSTLDRDANIIKGYAVMTKGEALGHNLWIDGVMLAQVAEAGNAASKGIKGRFTHPGLCSDGLGKYLGRSKNFRLDGDVVRADLHISPVADQSPDGPLGSYVLNMAEEDPDAFGASIVFSHDIGAEHEFAGAHENDKGVFVSPDPANTEGFPHARLGKLWDADIVDSPAANPGGFFHDGEELAVNSERVLGWLFGLDDTAPPAQLLGGIEPSRAKTFFTNFLDRHGLSVTALTKKEPEMAEKKVPERLAELRAAFPDDPAFVVHALENEWDVTQAKAAYCERLREQLAEGKTAWEALKAAHAEELQALNTEIEGLQAEIGKRDAELAGLKQHMLDGSDGVEFGGEGEGGTKNFDALVDDYQKANKSTRTEAMSAVAANHPEAYAAHVAAKRATE